MEEKPQRGHHAKQAGPKARKKDATKKKKKGIYEQSRKDRGNIKVSAVCRVVSESVFVPPSVWVCVSVCAACLRMFRLCRFRGSNV